MATPIPQNQCALTLGEITRATGGTLFGGTDTLAVRGVGIDSRNLRPGSVFVAIRGATHDGHAYLAQVAKGGAAAVVVERGRGAAAIPSVEVGDTLVALGDIARFHLERERAARAIPLLAVGGSAGKTTTKEMAAALVRTLFGRTLSTPGNLNNLVGAPMTVLTLTPEHRACVIECGTNVRGEMARLGAILSPDVALIVNVDVEHSEGLGTLESIADEETSILRFTRRAAVVPFEDALVTVRIPAGLGRIGFGHSPRADVRLISRLGTRDGSKITIGLAPALVAPNAPASVAAELRMLGPQAAINATAAVAAAAALWQKPLTREQVESIERALHAIAPVEGRLSTRTIAGAIVIDDSYNSNPRSVRAALSAADEAARIRKARLVIAMGDMLELGALS
ncbi:MAG: Mur ligase family protein, partial [Candidatus Binataceae bacterium]